MPFKKVLDITKETNRLSTGKLTLRSCSRPGHAAQGYERTSLSLCILPSHWLHGPHPHIAATDDTGRQTKERLSAHSGLSGFRPNCSFSQGESGTVAQEQRGEEICDSYGTLGSRPEHLPTETP